MGRRLFLGYAVAAFVGTIRPHTALGAPRRGPSLFFVGGEIAERGTAGAGYGTYARHRAVGTAGGIDFDIAEDARVYPVAAGIVTAVESDPVSGRWLTVGHGFYTSLYAHLAAHLVRVGQRVNRPDQIGVAGQTGYGAWVGPHLHLGLKADRIVRVVDSGRGKAVYADDVWLDPLDFAAWEAVDVHGNRTLPYFRGVDLDTPYRESLAVLQRTLDRAMSAIEGHAGDAGPSSGALFDADLGARLRRMWEASGVDRERRLEAERTTLAFLRAPFRLTAPLGDPGTEDDAAYR